MHSNSLASYDALKITDRQKEVYEVYRMGDYTDEEVANILGWPINRVTGRIGELIRAGLLYEVGNVSPQGRKKRVVGIIKTTLF